MTATILLVTTKGEQSFDDQLKALGAFVRTAENGSSAMSLAIDLRPDAILIDSRANNIDSIQLCRSLRSVDETARSVIVAVAPNASPRENLQLLESGADECWSDAFSSREFELRLKGILRRFEGGQKPQQVLRYADIELDLDRFKVRRNGRPLNLSPMQFRLLRYLMESPTIVFSRQQLLVDVWHEQELDEGAVTACVARLRRVLNAGGSSDLIKNVPAAGYALDCDLPARD